ncbi:uncharacterized protein LOC125658748 isoform X3 [Ostrea edulis]|uniref:uncharacterized protein LOC125658748 isoform X3 n=1 Tax=Ostrea edulis TaxID=37623 RepID=UPI0024AF41DF|nr:uncharacterized protein LOC125658748 isoform X3 [Ostrea edulis]
MNCLTMDGISSIRVSGGFPLSLSTRSVYIEIESFKLEFILSSNSTQQELDRELSVFYACVDWADNGDTGLYIRCTDPNRDILNWRKDVEGCLQHFVSNISVKATSLKSHEHSHILQKLGSLQNILMKTDLDSRTVYIIGLTYFVDKAIMEIERLECDDSSQEQQMEIPLSACEAFLLMNSGIENQITKQVKNVKMTMDLTEYKIKLLGCEKALISAKSIISNERYLIKERLVSNLSPERRYLIGLENAKKYLSKKIQASKALCFIDTSSLDAVKLCAFTEMELNKSENILLSSIVEEYVDIQGDFAGSISPTEYSPMFKQIESKYPGLVKIGFVPVEGAVHVVSVVDHSRSTVKEVRDILSRSQVFETVDLYRPCVFRYILQNRAEEIKSLSRKHNAVSSTNSKIFAIRVSGKYDDVVRFRNEIADIIQTIHWSVHHVSIPSRYKDTFPDICSAVETQIDCTNDIVNLSCISEAESEARKVIVMAGSLKYVECDVMVVYANIQHKPNCRQSELVVKAAGGMTIIKECKETALEDGKPGEWDVVATGAGKLKNCLTLLHIIIPDLSSDVQREQLEIAYHLCFSKIERQRFRSIAFSVTDKLSLSRQVQALAGTTKAYFTSRPWSGIRTVVFCDDRKSSHSFLYEFMSSRPSCDCLLEGHFKNDFTSHFVKTGAVSQNILIKGGTSLEKQLNSTEKRREMDKHGLVVTTSGDSCQIPALFIIHVDATSVRRTFSKVNLAWRKMVLKCLQKAEQMKLTSLAFPALGTGSLQGNIGATAGFILEAVEEFVKRKPVYLNQIYVVVLEQSVLVDLHNRIRDRYIDNMKLWNPDYEEDVCADVLICGRSQDIVNKAAQRIKTSLYAVQTDT